MLNVPNILTITRILLIPVYMCAMYWKHEYASQVACILFVVAAVTDMLDGKIARKYGLITNFGKVMDPVADKIMVTAAMVVLVDLHHLAAWIVILMLFRDFAVGALRDLAASQGTIIAAGIWGKLKTVLQMVALGMIIFYDKILIYPRFGLSNGGVSVSSGTIYLPVYELGMVVMYVALVASVFSGVMYFKQYYKKLAH